MDYFKTGSDSSYTSYTRLTNQYFADIATDPNYDPDQITGIKPTTSYNKKLSCRR